MTGPAIRERAARGLLGLLAMFLVGACDAVASVGNDPVPLPADLAAMLDTNLDVRFGPADASVPSISGTEAVERAGVHLLGDLEGNRVPAQDPSAPDGLVRRMMMTPGELPQSVWLVAYRWDAGFDCTSPAGGPGPCATTSFYFIDDRTGELLNSYSHTQ